MRLRKIVLVSALLGIGGLALLAAPLAGVAQARGGVYVGVGPGWWGPWWVYPWGYPAYSYPAPVPAPAPCGTAWIPGHWENRGRPDPGGFTTYQRVWVPGHWQRVCP